MQAKTERELSNPARYQVNKEEWVLFSLALLKFIIPFFLQHPAYEPHRDELLYLAEGNHMAWGFMEVPPLLSVFAWLTNVFGDGFFWIKCWPSLFGALTFLITGRIILSIGGRSFALLLAFLSFIFTGYLRVHFLFQPNFLEIFFWTMIAYSLIRFIQTERNQWLYIFGISAGLGMLSKYSVSFFTISVVIGLALTRQRKILTNRHFYYAALIGFLVFLPNLLWQAAHHFPVVFHMKKLHDTQLKYISPLSFLSGQVLNLFPCIFVWVTGLWFVSFSKGARDLPFYRLGLFNCYCYPVDRAGKALLCTRRLPGTVSLWCIPIGAINNPQIQGSAVCIRAGSGYARLLACADSPAHIGA